MKQNCTNCKHFTTERFLYWFAEEGDGECRNIKKTGPDFFYMTIMNAEQTKCQHYEPEYMFFVTDTYKRLAEIEAKLEADK